MAGDGGHLGRWVRDEVGSPAFDLAPGVELEPAGCAPPGGPWHQVGNRSITATVHSDGGTCLYEHRRGVVRLTDAARGWTVDGTLLPTPRVRWGTGYAHWSAGTGGVAIERRVWVPAGDDPLLRVDVEVRADRPVRYRERWAVRPRPLLAGPLMSRRIPPPAAYGPAGRVVWSAMFTGSAATRVAVETARSLVARAMRGRAERWSPGCLVFRPAARRAPRRRPRLADRGLPFVVVATLDDGPEIDGDALVAPVPAGVPTRLRYTVGLCDDEDGVGELIRIARAATPAGAARARRERLVLTGTDEVLARETAWHASYLADALVPDDFLGCRYVPQGSAYGFVHGVQGAPRDYAFSAVPLTFVDPAGARDVVRTMMRLTAPDGAMHYGHVGAGMPVSGGMHRAPTDLPLFLLWALTEYVFATRERAFLDESVPFWPRRTGAGTAVRERVPLAFRYVRDHVGVGTHGMLRVGSGDWMDPISAMVPRRRAFHRDGESAFNTALAVYVLPRAAALVRDDDPGSAAEMEEFASRLRTAMERAWTGRWFLRGWDGRERPIGDGHCFVDAQAWCLIARIGTDAQRATLVDEIARRCDDPSPIGATILDRPHPVRFGMLAPGWDCNGGVWAAVNALLAWGYSLHDPERARRQLVKQSLAAHAAAYPDVWYGVWSGPDAYNAWFGERAGETFVQPATPMTEFPVMNSNAHAGPLLALLRVLGLETTPDGPVVAPRGDAPPWSLATALGTFCGPQP